MHQKTIFFFLFLFCCAYCSAQQIASSGGYVLKSEISVDWILDGNLSDIPAYDEITLAGWQTEQLKESEIELKVYPTPARDFVNIEITQIDTVRLILKLFDNSGKLILNPITVVEPLMNLDISDIPPGIYFLKVFSQKSDQIFRSVKIVKTQTKLL